MEKKNFLREIRDAAGAFGKGLKRLTKAKTLDDLDEALPWGAVDFLLSMPAAVLLVEYIVVLWRDLPGEYYTLGFQRMMIYSFMTAFGLLGLGGYFLKKVVCVPREQRKPLKALLREHWPVLFFGLMAAMIFVSTAVNGLDHGAVYGHSTDPEGITTYLFYLLIMLPCGALMGDRRYKRILLCLLMYGGLLISLTVWVSVLYYPLPGVTPKPETWGYHLMVCGIFYNSNFYGYFTVIAMGVCAAMFMTDRSRWVKLLAIGCFVTCAAGQSWSLTTGAVIATGVEIGLLVIMLWLTTGRFPAKGLLFIPAYLAVGLAASFFELNAYTGFIELFRDAKTISSSGGGGGGDLGAVGNGRGILWAKSLEYIKARPLVGYGTNGKVEELAKLEIFLIEDKDEKRSHCEFLQYAVYYGIPGAVGYAGGCLGVFLRGLKLRDKLRSTEIAALTGAFGYLVSSAAGVTTFFITPLFFYLLGMGAAVREDKN